MYYKPGSLKAEVCVKGARRLREWVKERDLPINECGKVIIPTRMNQDYQLEVLADRGEKNGAAVELWTKDQLRTNVPEARSASGRALWSPSTAVVKPITVVRRLQEELKAKGVVIVHSQRNWHAEPEKSSIVLSDGQKIGYRHFVNCTGLQADRIAHQFGLAKQYTLLPFKGLYWQIKKSCPIQPRTNIYPVPDLSVPFLGVHFTPSADINPLVSIGPTATPAWGRENYQGLQGIEANQIIKSSTVLARQYIANKGGFRRYVHEQAFLAFPPLLLQSAQELVPAIRGEHIEISKKVGIRSQLFNQEKQRLEDDFLCLRGTNSTHILNAISPAFTASFALADLILDREMDHLDLR